MKPPAWRVIQIMKENGMDVTDKLLVTNCLIIYVTGQRDQLAEEVAKLKEINDHLPTL